MSVVRLDFLGAFRKKVLFPKTGGWGFPLCLCATHLLSLDPTFNIAVEGFYSVHGKPRITVETV